jgi:exodeoxyribonuclease-5
MTTGPVMNPGQQVAHDQIVGYITGKDKSKAMWALVGYAGTGKTFSLTQIVATLRKGGVRKEDSLDDIFGGARPLRIAMSAPTHKAVRVMKRFAKGLPGVSFATIHSLLGLKEQIDNNGKVKFVQSKDPDQIKIETFDVVIIDESSMLADELFGLLIAYAKRGIKLIFVGDPAQIPPVNHLDSKPFIAAEREKYSIGMVELTDIVRQSMDNPILAYATRIRKAYKTASDFPVETHLLNYSTPMSGILHLKEDDSINTHETIERYFNCEEFRQDADHMKIICWRNKTVDTFNSMVRKHIYRDQGELPFIMKGEKLIVDAPVVLPNGRILLSNNEEIEVSSYDISTATLDYFTMNLVNKEWIADQPEISLKYYNTFVKYFDEDGTEQEANIRILHESERLRLQGVLNEIKKAATAVNFDSPYRGKLWKSFYAVDRTFAAVKYNYAITSHKSQGSTYNNTMLIDWDIAVNRTVEERNRIRYVAATRARHLLIIVK